MKTTKRKTGVASFVRKIADPQQRCDSEALVELMREVTGTEPKMWGSIVGFGDYHYKYESGREGAWFLAGFSPRKKALTIYLTPRLDRHAGLLKKLGKHDVGKGCLYVKKLEDIHLPTLRALIERAVKQKP